MYTAEEIGIIKSNSAIIFLSFQHFKDLYKFYKGKKKTHPIDDMNKRPSAIVFRKYHGRDLKVLDNSFGSYRVGMIGDS